MQTAVILIINEKDFKNEEGTPFTDADLASFGREANEMAAHWLGYEGYQLKRGERFVLDPDTTRHG